eukprot:m.16114 g.16114  ORF g.16114 m.16114 type:complete len:108 (-) comp3476_c0_seq1:1273-1596(-)
MTAPEQMNPRDITVLLMEKISPTAVKAFEELGFTVRQAVGYSEDELIEAIADVHIIGVRSKTKLTRNVLSHAAKLQAIGCFCIGTDQVLLPQPPAAPQPPWPGAAAY